MGWLRRISINARIVRSALIFLVLLGFPGRALTQPVPAPAGCALPIKPLAPDATATLNPQRGWQMEGRDVEVMVTSSALAANAKPRVCFRWKSAAADGKFVETDPVRVLSQPSDHAPATLKLTAPVPRIGDWPVDYSVDNTAPMAEIRILVLDGDKHLGDVLTTIRVVGANDYCNVPNPGTRTDTGMVVPSAS